MPPDIKHLIDDIIEKEWNMFTNVNNKGGRASCQDDHKTFYIMRASQFEAWDTSSLLSYNDDLDTAISEGRSLPTEKYAYMMEYTAPEEYERIRGILPGISEEKEFLISEILRLSLKETEEFFEKYPGFKNSGRPLYRKDDHIFTSVETYMRGELKTYSENTLTSYLKHIKDLESRGESIVCSIYENTAHHYGYEDAAAAERSLRH